MTTMIHGGGSPLVEAPDRPAEATNDNFPVKAHWQTPAEAVPTIRGWRREMREELRAGFSPRACREHRRRWDLMHAMEKCALRVHFRVRKD